MSLQELCMNRIIQNISRSKTRKSFQLTDFIHKTPVGLHTKMIEKMINLIEKEICNYTANIMEIIVPYITDDIIATMVTVGRNRQNYYQIFGDTSNTIIHSAITIAEKLAISMEERYVRRAHDLYQDNYNAFHYSSDEENDDINYDSY
jgi:hypothetical protein